MREREREYHSCIPIIKFYSLLKSTVNCSTVLHGKQNGQLVETQLEYIIQVGFTACLSGLRVSVCLYRGKLMYRVYRIL